MKITLRELFLLTVIIGLLLGWWIDRTRLKSQGLHAEISARSYFDVSVFMAEMLKDQGAKFEWSPDDLTVRGGNGGGLMSISNYPALENIKEEMERNAARRDQR